METKMTDNAVDKSQAGAPAELMGAVDIGSNMIRMVIGQLGPNGDIEILERMQRAVYLGQDTFVRGKLGRKTMRAAIGILREFAGVLKTYEVRNINVVATSSVREASNSETFIDRVLTSTGLEVHVIDSSEESRLTMSAVRSEIGKHRELLEKLTMIAEVGGGSTVLTIIKAGQIVTSQSLGLGAVRLKEELTRGGESWATASELIRNEIKATLNAIEGLIPFGKIETIIAVGGDARFAAKHTSGTGRVHNLEIITKARFEKLVGRCMGMTAEQLCVEYDIGYPDAETLNPALMIYDELLHSTKAKNVLISHVSMRDGLLLDMARRIKGEEDPELSQAVIQSAITTAVKYRVDLKHASTVSDTAVKLFDELAGEHGLKYRHRLLLHVAAILHQVGTYISGRSYHKHTLYIVSNSEIFGLTQNEVQMVAHIARYHRRGRPKPSHFEYMSLTRERRIVVNKLAAILRLAVALTTSKRFDPGKMQCKIDDEDFVISLGGKVDSAPARRSVETMSDMFRDIYGLRAVLI